MCIVLSGLSVQRKQQHRLPIDKTLAVYGMSRNEPQRAARPSLWGMPWRVQRAAASGQLVAEAVAEIDLPRFRRYSRLRCLFSAVQAAVASAAADFVLRLILAPMRSQR